MLLKCYIQKNLFLAYPKIILNLYHIMQKGQLCQKRNQTDKRTLTNILKQHIWIDKYYF